MARPQSDISKRRIHIAIMRKSWGLTQKLLTGEKTAESRWYMNRSRPWGRINPGDVVYFKDSGEPVRIKAIVDKVLQFENLNPRKVKEILQRYGREDGLGIDPRDMEKYFFMFERKRYCLIIFLRDIKEIEPFDIDKSGFGAMSAWLAIDNLERIRRN